MKTLLIGVIIIIFAGCYTSNAQKSGIGIHFGGNDFYGPQTGKYFRDKVYNISKNIETNLSDTIVKEQFRWHPLVRFSYWRQLSRHIDVSANLNLGNADYPATDNDLLYIERRKYGATKFVRLLAELDARINYNILSKERYFISPYLFAGISGSHRPGYFGATIPVGAGINFNVTRNKDFYLNLESGYKIAATGPDQNHLQHVVGFVYWFKPGFKMPKAEKKSDLPGPPVIPDSDGDGVNDIADECPSIAGLAQFKGCPDSDGDGIPDHEDECPLVAGISQFKGCPDSDGDGISDKEDKCPYLAGVAAHGGCPIPDRDGDGFNDDEDRCPDVYSKTNGGCPEIRKETIRAVEKAAKAIFFETGKATIRKSSFNSLDAIAVVLKSDTSLYADIEGHTDNVGEDAANLSLSQRRAQAVMDYVISRGIDVIRLTARGLGASQPIADNATAAGRALNRRTVIKLRNFDR